jgi:hypothetical protein
VPLKASSTLVVAAPFVAAPSLGEAQPLLSHILLMMEAGSGEQLLRMMDADIRDTAGAQALSREYEQMVRGVRPVHVSQVEFKGETREGRLLVTGRFRLHAGDPTEAYGQRLLLRAEFAHRGGRVRLTSLSGVPD